MFTTTAPPPGNQHSRIVGLGGTGLSGDITILPTGKLRGRGGGAQALEEAIDPDANESKSMVSRCNYII